MDDIRHYYCTPVDHCTIQTTVRISPAFMRDPEAFIRRNNLPIRTIRPANTRGTRSLTLDILTYKGVRVTLKKVAGRRPIPVVIEFNPGVCLYGHNGHILHQDQFLDALGILASGLTPLLQNPDDAIDLIPGLRQESPAYWSYLEIPFHCHDPDGTLLECFRNLRHPSIRTPSRHWKTSIEIGGPRSNLRLSIYRKAVEMVAHGKLSSEELGDHRDIVRFEARLKGNKLVRYFDNPRNTAIIDGEKRLVCFYPRDLVQVHRSCFGELKGVYRSTADPGTQSETAQLASLGRFIAATAEDSRTTLTSEALLSSIRYYTGGPPSTIGKLRKAALAELSGKSPLSVDEIFPESAYASQSGIIHEEFEQKVCHDLPYLSIQSLITKAYRPPDQPCRPHIEIPRYIRNV